MSYLRILLLLLLVISCKKEELPISPNLPSGVELGQASMAQDYRYQLYYDLETNTVVGQNLKTDWDLGFITTEHGHQVKTNAANAMSVANFGNISLDSKTDTLGFSWYEKFDVRTGNIDSTAIGDWRTESNLYVVNRGYSYTGQHRGFYKLIIHNYDQNKYTIEVAEITETSGILIEINKLPDYNFSFFSFDNNEQVMIEPPKVEWDLTFTQYVHIFYEPAPIPYLVTGALLNSFQTRAIEFNDLTFEDIELIDVINMNLSSHSDIIGYDWKTFENGSFTIHSDKTYIIQDQTGFFYKLRFIDFYDQNGQKGTPKWECQKL